MEKTTLINGNGHPYEREVPKVVILTYFNPVALENLRKQTGIDFKENPFGNIEGQPQTWEQFAKIFLTYNFLTDSGGNTMYLRGACHMPTNATLYYKKEGREFLGVSGLDY